MFKLLLMEIQGKKGKKERRKVPLMKSNKNICVNCSSLKEKWNRPKLQTFFILDWPINLQSVHL